ncbi:MAG: extracellular solute-binding protein [Thermoflavifilum sp.]|nr:extracellular solute-binding protein [Thermoflavifilum sp.]MCL6514110.1 extracellular solute-binding protein [Alicyclobacillus sp.]
MSRVIHGLRAHRRLLQGAGIPVALMALVVSGCGAPSNGGQAAGGTQPVTLSVLYAGSMTKVMEDHIVPDALASLGAKVEGEAQGSAALAQLIRSGLRKPDVFISASPAVVQNLLMGSANRNLARWYVPVAEDEMVIAYSPKSRFAAQLADAASGKMPWYQVLAQPGFRLGRTDPQLDPKGVSTLFTFQLAERYYHLPGLTRRLLGDTENPKQVYPEETLLAMLETGQLDAVMAYRHEAVEWQVPFISLPDEINLGNPADAKLYQTAVYTPAKGQAQHGAPILFVATVPSTSTHPAEAAAFVAYLVNGRGHEILMDDGFRPAPASIGGDTSAVPDVVRQAVERARGSGT